MRKLFLGLLFAPALASASIRIDTCLMMDGMKMTEMCTVEDGCMTRCSWGDIMLEMMPTSFDDMCCIRCKVLKGDREVCCPEIRASWGQPEEVRLASDDMNMSLRFVVMRTEDTCSNCCSACPETCPMGTCSECPCPSISGK
jgi:hypothetical protein